MAAPNHRALHRVQPAADTVSAIPPRRHGARTQHERSRIASIRVRGLRREEPLELTDS